MERYAMEHAAGAPRRIAVFLTFDIDAETLWTSRDKQNPIGPVMLSQGYYGPEVGLPRILSLLKRWDLPATFFVTGYVADRYADECRQIVEHGHEIGHHNYSHEWPARTPHDEERKAFAQGMESLYRLTGSYPEGYRAPGWEFSDITFDLLRENGMRYSSNMMDGEFPYEFLCRGERTGIFELPCSWILDDAAFFMHGLTYGAPMFPASHVFEQWQDEFDGMYADEGERVYVLTMHPQIIGRPSRMALLERLIAYIRTKPGAEFFSCGSYVRMLKEQSAVQPVRTREFYGRAKQ
jgi:peptidoglycan-N-acetylglucosamine deacetylase